MKKNAASQVVGAQMIALDGSAFTGSVTVYVTGNGGTQAVGSVGAGACTHEGNGYHNYAPAQAETNYDHVAFTFIGSGAIPATVQIYPTFPQTGDAYAATGTAIPAIKQVTDKLHSMVEAAPGSPGESRFTADAVARIQTVLGIAAGNIDTQLAALATLIGTRLAAASYTAPDNATITAIATYVDTEVAAVKAVTDRLATMLTAAAGSPNEFKFTADAVQAVQSVLGIGAANVDAQFTAVLAAISTRLASASYTAPNNAAILLIKEITDRFYPMLEPAPGSPGEFRYTADALVRAPSGTGGGGGGLSQSDVRDAVGLATANLDTQLGAIAGYIDTEVAAIRVVTDRLATMLTAAAGSPGEFKFTADAVQAVQSVLGVAAANLDAQIAAVLTAIGTRLATAGYTAPDNTGIASIKTVTDRVATMLTAAPGSPGEFKLTADALQSVQAVLGVSAANVDAQFTAVLAAVATRLSTAGYTAPNNAGIAAIREITDRFFAMLEPASGSPNEFRFSADALARVQTVLGSGGANLDVQLAAIFARAVAIEVDTQDIQGRLPAALTGGRMDASIGAAQANTITAAALAADAVAEIQAGLATSSQGAAVQAVTDRLATMLTAAAGSPGEFKFTADAVQAVQAVLGVSAANIDAQLAALLAAIGTRLASASYTAPNNAAIVLIKEITDRFYAMMEPASGSPGEFRYTADALVRAPTGSGGGGGGLSQADVRDAVGLASANLDAQLSAIAGYVDTEVAAIREVTDRLATMLTAAAGSPGEFKFTPDAVQAVQAVLGVAAANVDAQLSALSTAIGTRLAAAAYTAPDNATIAAIAGYLDTEVASIKQVTDRLATMLEAAAGSPGEFRFSADAIARVQTVLGVAAANLDTQLAALAAIASSRATQASVDAVAGYIDTEVAAIKAKTDALPADPADASDIAAAFAVVNGTLATIDGRIDAEVPAIKAVTDALGTMVQAAPGSPGEYRFTEDALELAPTGSGGGGGGTDWSAGEREQIRHRLGIDGSATAPSATPSLASAANLAAVAGYLDTEVAEIKAVTDALGTTIEPAAGSPGEYRFTPDALEAAPTGGGGGGGSAPTASENADAVRAELAPELGIIAKLDTLLEPSTGSPGEFRLTREAVGQGADAVLDAVRADHVRPGSVGEAIFDTDLRGRRTVVRGTVGTGSTATSIVTDAFDPAGVDANQFRGRIVVFDDDTVTAALRGQATDITASTAAALPVLTVTSLTAAPAAGDTFSVL